MYVIIKVDSANQNASVVIKDDNKENAIDSFAKLFCKKYGYDEDAEYEDIILDIIDSMTRLNHFNDYESIDGEGDAEYYLIEI